MALQVVNLTDTFDEWRVKTNLTATQFGDLTALSTTNKSSLVAAINEIFSNDSDDLENIVEDTTPQLGGNLDLNSKIINGTGSIAGTVTGTTQSPGNNSTKLATTAYVDAQVATEDTLAEMNDTTISGSANLDLLQYNSSSSVWENKAIGSVVGATQTAGDNSTLLATTAFVHSVVQSEDTLAEMNDTTISSPANLDVLQYDSGTSRWVNTAMVTQAAGNNSTLIATTAFVHSVVASEDTLLEMNDTTISNPQNLDVLQYTGSVWENQVLSAGVSIDDATALAIALG